MTLSLVTPVFNGMPYLRVCVESVLEQEVTVEYVVKDAGSTDGTMDFLAESLNGFGATWFSRHDAGLYDAILQGFEKTSGEVMAWLGCDDRLSPWAAKTIVDVFRRNPHVRWITGIPSVYSWTQGTGYSRQFVPVHARVLIRAGAYHPARMGCLMQETMFWRRDLWNEVNAPSIIGRYKLAGDYHLWKAFASKTRLWSVSSVLGIAGTRSDQLSKRRIEEYIIETGCSRSRLPTWVWRMMVRLVSIGGQFSILKPSSD